MTLKEAVENGVDYWEFFVLVEGKQIHVAGKIVKRCWYFESRDTVSINNLSAPAGLESVAEGNGWYQFRLGDGRLVVWPRVRPKSHNLLGKSVIATGQDARESAMPVTDDEHWLLLRQTEPPVSSII